MQKAIGRGYPTTPESGLGGFNPFEFPPTSWWCGDDDDDDDDDCGGIEGGGFETSLRLEQTYGGNTCVPEPDRNRFVNNGLVRS